MGRINKSLNRSNYKQVNRAMRPPWGNNNNNSRQMQDFNERQIQREDKKDLKIVEITPEQQGRKDLKFVYTLPQTIKDVKNLLRDQPEEDKKIIVMRIRDYYNPIIEPKNTDKFKKFVVCLTSFYLQKDLESVAVREHLKELCSGYAILFSAFLKSKIKKILEVLKELNDNSENL